MNFKFNLLISLIVFYIKWSDAHLHLLKRGYATGGFSSAAAASAAASSSYSSSFQGSLSGAPNIYNRFGAQESGCAGCSKGGQVEGGFQISVPNILSNIFQVTATAAKCNPLISNCGGGGGFATNGAYGGGSGAATGSISIDKNVPNYNYEKHVSYGGSYAGNAHHAVSYNEKTATYKPVTYVENPGAGFAITGQVNVDKTYAPSAPIVKPQAPKYQQPAIYVEKPVTYVEKPATYVEKPAAGFSIAGQVNVDKTYTPSASTFKPAVPIQPVTYVEKPAAGFAIGGQVNVDNTYASSASVAKAEVQQNQPHVTYVEKPAAGFAIGGQVNVDKTYAPSTSVAVPEAPRQEISPTYAEKPIASGSGLFIGGQLNIDKPNTVNAPAYQMTYYPPQPEQAPPTATTQVAYTIPKNALTGAFQNRAGYDVPTTPIPVGVPSSLGFQGNIQVDKAPVPTYYKTVTFTANTPCCKGPFPGPSGSIHDSKPVAANLPPSYDTVYANKPESAPASATIGFEGNFQVDKAPAPTYVQQPAPCCKGPFPAPEGSIHESKPAPITNNGNFEASKTFTGNLNIDTSGNTHVSHEATKNGAFAFSGSFGGDLSADKQHEYVQKTVVETPQPAGQGYAGGSIDIVKSHNGYGNGNLGVSGSLDSSYAGNGNIEAAHSGNGAGYATGSVIVDKPVVHKGVAFEGEFGASVPNIAGAVASSVAKVTSDIGAAVGSLGSLGGGFGFGIGGGAAVSGTKTASYSAAGSGYKSVVARDTRHTLGESFFDSGIDGGAAASGSKAASYRVAGGSSAVPYGGGGGGGFATGEVAIQKHYGSGYKSVVTRDTRHLEHRPNYDVKGTGDLPLGSGPKHSYPDLE